MCSYIAFAIVCLILIGTISLILRYERSGYRGPWPSREPKSKEVRPVHQLNAVDLRTQEELDALFADCMAQLRAIGVPISESINPSIILSRTRASFGDCRIVFRDSSESGYDYVIRLSKYTLANSERSLRNTIYHELIHTVPGCLNHRKEWKKWAAYVSEQLGYHIQRVGGVDDTSRDLENLSLGVFVPVERTKSKRQAKPASCEA